MSKGFSQPTPTHLPLWYQPLSASFDVLNAAHQLDPGPESWGYLAHHSGNACGPPVSFGVFLWFASFEEMLQALVQGELRMEHDNDELDAEAQADVFKMRIIADRLAANPHETDSACHDFSEVFDFLELEWLGQFKVLTLGGSEYAREMRIAFRELDDDEMGADDSPIRAEERLAFIEQLRIWAA
jgi:hypothetical protein